MEAVIAALYLDGGMDAEDPHVNQGKELIKVEGAFNGVFVLGEADISMILSYISEPIRKRFPGGDPLVYPQVMSSEVDQDMPPATDGNNDVEMEEPKEMVEVKKEVKTLPNPFTEDTFWE